MVLANVTRPRRVTILGATVSVGQNTLDLINRSPDAYQVVALTAQRNVDLLASQARQSNAGLAVIGDEDLYKDLRDALAGTSVRVAAGEAALCEAADQPSDWVMAGIVGAAGLRPAFSAFRRGAIVALAHKEGLGCAGEVMLDEMKRGGGAGRRADAVGEVEGGAAQRSRLRLSHAAGDRRVDRPRGGV